jgi:hypothetical protein
MKTTLSLAFLISVVLSCTTKQLAQSTRLQCSKFMNGTFEQYSDSIRIETVRFDSIQIEKLWLGEIMYKVKWTSECEYNLELLSSTIEAFNNKVGRKYFITILSTDKNEYSYECMIEGADNKVKGTLKKIK